MSVTFDNAQLSPQRVIERVRDTGAPVTPLAIAREAPHNLGEWFLILALMGRRQKTMRPEGASELPGRDS